MFWSGCPSDLTSLNTALLISNKKMNDIVKINKSIKESVFFIKGITIKNEDTLGASLLGNLLKAKDIIRAGEGTIRAGQDF